VIETYKAWALSRLRSPQRLPAGKRPALHSWHHRLTSVGAGAWKWRLKCLSSDPWPAVRGRPADVTGLLGGGAGWGRHQAPPPTPRASLAGVSQGGF